jgi:hypothetical protein
MDGLRYLMGEIQERRFLLHDFVRHIQEPKTFRLFNGDAPPFVKDGQITFRANRDAVYKGLTVSEFNNRYLKEFLNSTIFKSIMVSITPSTQPPNNYKFQEFLRYEYGARYCLANMLFSLETPTLSQKFILVIQDTVPHKPIFRYIKNGREWAYPNNFKVSDKELEKLLIMSHPYARWQGNKKTARTRLNPGSQFYKSNEGYYRREGEKGYTVPTIIINQETPEARIWTQLIVHGWGYGYFTSVDDQQAAWKELKHYWFPGHMGSEKLHVSEIDEIMGELIEHLRKHAVIPYSPATAGAYFGQLIKGYKKKTKYQSGGLTNARGEKTEESTGTMRVVDLGGIEGSVPYVTRVLNIPEGTIYRWIRQGKINYALNSDLIIIISDDEIEKLHHLVDTKKKRKDDKILALKAGKRPAAIRKYFQRNKNPSEDDFRRWLRFNRRKPSK